MQKYELVLIVAFHFVGQYNRQQFLNMAILTWATKMKAAYDTNTLWYKGINWVGPENCGIVSVSFSMASHYFYG